MADFFADFNDPAGPAHAQALPDSGCTVNPPLSFSLGAAESLKSGLNWSLLVARIATMIFIFPNTPVGIRSAIVLRQLVPGAGWRCRGSARRRRSSSARQASHRRARTSSATRSATCTSTAAARPGRTTPTCR